MKFSKIKNIELKKVDPYISCGVDKAGNLTVIKVVSKYFPLNVTETLIAKLLQDKNVLNDENEKVLVLKIHDILMSIKNKAFSGESIFVVVKEKGSVELVKD